MGTKLLNLDELAPVIEKQITLKGVTHKMQSPTVADIIKDAQRQKEIDTKYGSNVPFEVSVQLMCELIQMSFPTMPMADVQGLTVEQMVAIKQLIMMASEPSDEDKSSGN